MSAVFKPHLLLAAMFAAAASGALAEELAIPIPECGLGPWQMCRYIDPVTSNPVTDVKFQLAEPFYEGLAGVRVDGLFGFIDRSGTVVIPPTFEQVSRFRFGLAEVSDGVNVDLIDKEGRVVLTTDFRRAIPVSPNVVMAFDDDRDAAAEFNAEPAYTTPELWRDPQEETVYVFTRSGLYDIKRGWIATPPVRSFQPIPGASGRFWLQIAEPGDGWDRYDWGLMGEDGEWIIGPGIMDVVPLSGGLSIVFDPPTGLRDGHDSNFGWELDRNHDGWEAVIDENGELIGGTYFDDVGVSTDGKPTVWKDGVWFEIDGQGAVDRYDGTPTSYWNQLRHSEPPRVLTIDRASDDAGLACKDGVTLFSEPMNDSTGADAAASPFDLRWGLMDASGTVMVPAEHRYITCPQHGIALVPDAARGLWCPVGPHLQAATSGTCQAWLWDGWIREFARREKLDDDPFESEVKWWQQQLLWSQFPDLVDEPKWVSEW